MPHDSKGKKICEGDVIKAKHWMHGSRQSAVLVHGLLEGSESCNVIGTSVQAPNSPPQSFNAKEVEILLKHDGTAPV